MSLDALRNAISSEKKNEIKACEISRKRKLRELYAVTTNYLRVPSQTFDFLNFNFEAPLDREENIYLDNNDITKGRYFDESTLPKPVSHGPASIPQPTVEPSVLPSVSAEPLPPASGISTEPGIERSSSVIIPEERLKPGPETLERPTSIADGPVVDQRRTTPAPIATHDTISGALAVNDQLPSDLPQRDQQDALHIQQPRPSIDTSDKFVQLPSPITADEGRTPKPLTALTSPRPEPREGQKLTIPGGVNGDMQSSPTSTAGVFSVNTPLPAAASPNTSLDEETSPAQVDRLSRKLGTPTPAIPVEPTSTQSPTGAASSDRPSIGDLATPDAQLQLEHFEAGLRQSSDKQNADPKVNRAIDQMAPSQTVNGIDDGRSPLPTKAIDKDGANAIEQVHNTTAVEDIRMDDAPHPLTVEDVSKTETTSQEGLEQTTAASRSVSSTEIKEPLAIHDSEAVSAQKPTPSTAAGTPVMEERPKMITRTSSGAIRPRSVSEILGETPRSGSSSDRANPATPAKTHPPTPELPSAVSKKGSPWKQRRQESDAHKQLAVVPYKKESTNVLEEAPEGYLSLKGALHDSKKDYLQTLFSWQAHQPPRSVPLTELLQSASKTVTTSNQYAALREFHDHRILRRVYHLQNANRWSFRQMERLPEPPRPTSHIDHLLREAKWMRTDFREERKWKIATAFGMAKACAQWVSSEAEERVALQVKVRRPPTKQTEAASEAADQSSATAERTPELVPDSETESFDSDILDLQLYRDAPPAALFSLPALSTTFVMPSSSATEKLLSELPLYEHPGSLEPPQYSYVPEHANPIVPVSKYIQGRIVPKAPNTPRKRSRYEYNTDSEEFESPAKRVKKEDDSIDESRMPRSMRRNRRPELSPEKTDVALFNPENQHFRDRLAAGQAFRPPSDSIMPSLAFFQERISSQWMAEEDQKLRQLVKEHTYNWSLISSELTVSPTFVTASERRTPWECFERWVQIEGLPAEMQKTPYFRTYHSRREAAQQTITARHLAAQQAYQQQQNGAPTPGLNSPLRKKTSQPVRVERRKNSKYLSLLDAMRKLARKREQAEHKKQEAAKAALMRKAHESAPQKSNIHTPQEFSKIKYERELRAQEERENYRRRVMAEQQRQAQMQQRSGQAPMQPSMSNNMAGQGRMGPPNGIPNQMPNGVNMATGHASQTPNMGMQARPVPAQLAMQANMSGSNHLGVPNVPQANMQVNMSGQNRMPNQQIPDNLRVVMEANRQAAQHNFTGAGQQFPSGQGRPNSSSINQHPNVQNPQLLAALQSAANHHAGMNGQTNNMPSNGGQSGSPRMAPPNTAHSSQPQGLSSGHIPAVNHIAHQIQSQNPQLSPEQLKQLTNERLKGQIYQQQRQSALNAAAGASAATSGNLAQNPYSQLNGMNMQNGGSPPSTTQAYQQSMHLRMLQQQRERAQQSGSPAVNGNRSETPQQQHMQRNSSANLSNSPRPPSAQMSAGQS